MKGFFEHLDHSRLMEFLSIRIAAPKISRLVVKFLKAGVMEEGGFFPSSEGAPQGGIISPLLANIYLRALSDENYNYYKTCEILNLNEETK